MDPTTPSETAALPLNPVIPPRNIRDALPYLPMPSLTPVVSVMGGIEAPRVKLRDLVDYDLSFDQHTVTQPTLHTTESPYLQALIDQIDHSLARIPHALRRQLENYRNSVFTRHGIPDPTKVTKPPKITAPVPAEPTPESSRNASSLSPGVHVIIEAPTQAMLETAKVEPPTTVPISNVPEAAFQTLDSFITEIFSAEDTLAQETTSLAGPTTGSSMSNKMFRVESGDSMWTPTLRQEVLRRLRRGIAKAAQYQQLVRFSTGDLARLLKILEQSIQEADKIDLKAVFGEQLDRVPIDQATDMEREGQLEVMEALEVAAQTVANGIEASMCVMAVLTGGPLSKKLYNEDLIVTILAVIKKQLNDFVCVQFELKDNEDDRLNQFLARDSKVRRLLSGLVPSLSAIMESWIGLLACHDFSDSVVISLGFITIPIFFIDLSKSLRLLTTNNLAALRLTALHLLRAIFAQYPSQRTWILEEILCSLIKLPTASRNLRQYKLVEGRSIQLVAALVMQLIQSCAEIPLTTRSFIENGSLKVAEPDSETTATTPTTLSANSLEIKQTYQDAKEYLRHFKGVVDAAGACASYVVKFLLGRCAKTKHSNELEYKVLLENLMDDVLTALGHPEWPVAELILRVFVKHLMSYADDKKADHTLKTISIDYLGTIGARIKKWHPLQALPLEMGDSSGKRSPPALSAETVALFTEPELDLIHLATLEMRQIPLGDITGATPIAAIHHLWDDQQAVLIYLHHSLRSNHELREAACFQLAEWGFSGFNALVRYGHGEARDEFDELMPEVLKQLLSRVCHWYQRTSRHIQRGTVDPITNSSAGADEPLDMERNLANVAAEILASRQPLYQSFDAILARILAALDLNIVAFRTKALKALGQIIGVYPVILSQANVKAAINQRLQDSSPAVRDAAIELVSRYLSHRPDIIQQYYRPISERILDMGLNVRKRVIRLLRDIYSQIQDQEMQIDIADRIMHRINDEDSNVSQLAYKTIQELWFSDLKADVQRAAQSTSSGGTNLPDLGFGSPNDALVPNGSHLGVGGGMQPAATGLMSDSNYHLGTETAGGTSDFASLSASERAAVAARYEIILGVIQKPVGGSNQSEVMGEVIRQLLVRADKTELTPLLTLYSIYVEALMDHLLTLEEANDHTEIQRCVHLLYLFSVARPQLFTEAHVMALLPYLKDSASPNEQRVLQYVLMAIQQALPELGHPSPDMLVQIEKELLAILTKSPQLILNVAVPCLCRIVTSQTKSFHFLTRILRSCVDKLTSEIRGLKTGKPLAAPKSVMRMMILLGLLGRYFDFDVHRAKYPDKFKELHSYPVGQVNARIFNSIIYFTGPTLARPVRLGALQSIGQLFQAHPTLMLQTESRKLMDAVFSSGDPELLLQLLKCFAEYLANEQMKLGNESGKDAGLGTLTTSTSGNGSGGGGGSAGSTKRGSKTVDLSILIGNAQELGEAGVGSSLMQCYLDDIIQCVMLKSQPLKIVATDVIGCIITQGLAHPLKCVPILVALQTDSHLGLRDKATKLHNQLNGKFSSFIHSRTLDGVRKAFEYQTALKSGSGAPVAGYTLDHKENRPRALVDTYYGILREKKNRRNDFLHGLVKTFDMDLHHHMNHATNTGEIDIAFCKFLAETLFALDYKLIEEALYVIYCIQRLLAVTGLHIQHQFSQGFAELSKESQIALAKISICVGMLVLLKDHLKLTYSLTESRCQQFSPSDTGMLKDKYLTRHQAGPLIFKWDKLPYVNKEIVTDHDLQVQRLTYCSLVGDIEDSPSTASAVDISPAKAADHTVEFTKPSPCRENDSSGPENPAAAPFQHHFELTIESTVGTQGDTAEYPVPTHATPTFRSIASKANAARMSNNQPTFSVFNSATVYQGVVESSTPGAKRSHPTDARGSIETPTPPGTHTQHYSSPSNSDYTKRPRYEDD
ncbi:Sister chromatid cohesion protein 2 [Dimargaris cristalligena]|nr:Sister chromatid cohesion protein 2 [Dimargaris cristalligena]